MPLFDPALLLCWSTKAGDLGCRKSAYREGGFTGGVEGLSARKVTRSLEVHQLQVLLAARNPAATQAAPA